MSLQIRLPTSVGCVLRHYGVSDDALVNGGPVESSASLLSAARCLQWLINRHYSSVARWSMVRWCRPASSADEAKVGAKKVALILQQICVNEPAQSYLSKRTEQQHLSTKLVRKMLTFRVHRSSLSVGLFYYCSRLDVSIVGLFQNYKKVVGISSINSRMALRRFIAFVCVPADSWPWVQKCALCPASNRRHSHRAIKHSQPHTSVT